ncbi:MAG: VWA domain-containing protein [Clostridia bacterium]|nr:VWA domain-containing protein [Clostridia bacterium]
MGKIKERTDLMTNIYFIIDCSMNITEQEKLKIQKALIGYNNALKLLPNKTKAHYIGYSNAGFVLNPFSMERRKGTPRIENAFELLGAMLQLEKGKPKTRSIFILFSATNPTYEFYQSIRALEKLPDFTNGLRYSVCMPNAKSGEKKTLLRFCEYPDRLLYYFSPKRLQGLVTMLSKRI